MVVLLLVLLAVAGSRQAPAPNAVATGSVEGVVRHADSGEPVVAAKVTLAQSWSNRGPRTYQTDTDDKGRFLFKDVPAGSYSVSAAREGYLLPNDSQEPFTLVNVAAEQRVEDVVVRMVPCAILSGRMLDAEGNPVVGTSVWAGPVEYPNGRRLIANGYWATTDDRGEYRFFTLKADAYYLRASYQPIVDGMPPYAYFPGTFDEAAATPVRVRAGDEVSGMDLVVPPLPPIPPMFTVSGTILGMPASVSDKPVESILVLRRDRAERFHILRPNTAGDRTGGRFQIRGLAPGTYDLWPRIRDERGQPYTARASIEVRDRNISGLKIAVSAGGELKGRVIFEGPFPKQPGFSTFSDYLALVTIPSISSRDGFPADLQVSLADRVDPKTGEFTFRSLHAGGYAVEYGVSLPRGVYFADVRQAGKSIFDQGLAIGAGTPEPIELVLSSIAGIVEGEVQDSFQKPVAGATVVLVPAPARRSNARVFRTATSDKTGHFSIVDAAPGEYKVFAWSAVPREAWLNAEFMSNYEPRGAPVFVAEGASSRIAVTAIPEENP
jgi:hypothetical protein